MLCYMRFQVAYVPNALLRIILDKNDNVNINTMHDERGY
mgnify:CR=1 FL=1